MGSHRLQFAVLMDFPFTSIYQQEIRSGLERYFEETDIDAVYFSIGDQDPQLPSQYLRQAFLDFLRPDIFDGVIVCSGTLLTESRQSTLRQHLANCTIPMTSIASHISDEPTISIDNAVGFRDLLNHLIEHHRFRRFAFVSGPLSHVDAQRRHAEFHRVLEEHGIPHSPKLEYFGNFSIDDGFPAVSELLDVRKLNPQVIVCSNDHMALGVWHALNRRGIAVPHDIAVTGFDDVRISDILSLQLTTVHQPIALQAYRAAEHLHLMINGSTSQHPITIQSRLIVRHSCSCWNTNAEEYSAVDLFHEPIVGAIRAEFHHLLNQFEAGISGKSLLQAWAKISFSALQQGISIEEIDHLLLETTLPEMDPDSFIQSCRVQSMQDFIQSDLTSRTFSRSSVERLRDTIDALSLEMSMGKGFSAIPEHLDRLAQALETKSLVIVQFEDHRFHSQGGRVLFANMDGKRKKITAKNSRVKTNRLIPESFYPDRRKSIVALMLNNQRIKFGYVLMDALVKGDDVYEYLRSRLSISLETMVMMETTQNLNAELMKQIQVRQDAENKLQQALEKVESLSVSDELTGLLNRRGFLNSGEQQLKYLRRQREGHFVIFVDLDGLKIINDTWGHREGDLALVTAAQILRGSIREVDLLARLGGDEFTALISQTDPPAFEVIKKRIQDSCDVQNRRSGKPWRISMSIGHYVPQPQSTETLESILEKADQDLYIEKARKKTANSKIK